MLDENVSKEEDFDGKAKDWETLDINTFENMQVEGTRVGQIVVGINCFSFDFAALKMRNRLWV